MKASLIVIAALLVAGVATAQTNAPNPTPQAGTPAATAPVGPHQPQAKSKEEFEAYNLAATKTDPAQMEAAAEEFAQKYPASELRELLYVRAMNLYQQQNSATKVIAMGRKAIAITPTDPIPLIAVASALVLDTRDNDLDKESRLAEAAKDAQAGLDNVDTGLQVPPNAPADRVALAKANLRSIAYDTLGVIAMNKKDYAAAEQNFQKAADLMKDQPDAVVYLRLSVAQDNEKKYEQALESANKAAQYAQEGSMEKNMAKQQQDRLQKLIAETKPAPAPPAASVPQH